jgi:hypothetical protein
MYRGMDYTALGPGYDGKSKMFFESGKNGRQFRKRREMLPCLESLPVGGQGFFKLKGTGVQALLPKQPPDNINCFRPFHFIDNPAVQRPAFPPENLRKDGYMGGHGIHKNAIHIKNEGNGNKRP